RSNAGLIAQPQLLMLPLGQDKGVLAALKNGKVLTIGGPEDTALFSLKGSGKALTSLQTCVDVGSGKIKAPPPGAAPAAGKPGKAPKFPPSLLGLLKASGLKNLEIVNIADPSKAPVDFAWKTQGVLGGLRERQIPPDMTLEKMSDIIGGGYKDQC